jgi:hypothetical protein
MSLLIHGRTLAHSRAPAAKWTVRATAARAARMVASVVQEGWQIVLTMAALLVLVSASLALDVWIWVPRSDH